MNWLQPKRLWWLWQLWSVVVRGGHVSLSVMFRPRAMKLLRCHLHEWLVRAVLGSPLSSAFAKAFEPRAQTSKEGGTSNPRSGMCRKGLLPRGASDQPGAGSGEQVSKMLKGVEANATVLRCSLLHSTLCTTGEILPDTKRDMKRRDTTDSEEATDTLRRVPRSSTAWRASRCTCRAETWIRARHTGWRVVPTAHTRCRTGANPKP